MVDPSAFVLPFPNNQNLATCLCDSFRYKCSSERYHGGVDAVRMSRLKRSYFLVAFISRKKSFEEDNFCTNCSDNKAS